MNIRKAKKGDLEEISKIFREESSKKPYFQEWTGKTVLEKIKKAFKNDSIYVILIDDKVIGFIDCQPDKNKKQVYIAELWLIKDFQGKWLGSKTMKFIEAYYKKTGFTTFTLMANRKSRAVEFYKKLNYKIKHELFYMTKRLK